MKSVACLVFLIGMVACFPQSKPGCQSKCGDLLVPFPFGISLNCSLDEKFVIYCNTSTHPPKAYYQLRAGMDLHITKINHTQVLASSPSPGFACSVDIYQSIYIILTESPFLLSEQNSITAVGYNLFMRYMSNYFGGTSNTQFSLNRPLPLPFCDYTRPYSSSPGCCIMPVPKGIRVLVANVSQLISKLGKNCGFVVIGQKFDSNISYSPDILENTSTFLQGNMWRKRPLILDWLIPSTTSACKGNTIRSKVDDGHVCNCKKGYEGNPYLGCQDINECHTQDDCNGICINSFGGYYCTCPKGYYGDGRISGTGCIKFPRSKKIINILIGLASGTGFLLFLALIFWLRNTVHNYKNKKIRENYFKINGGLILQKKINESPLDQMKIFSVKEIERATDNFNESRILGKGGQGTVYKGMLRDGKTVAIKKSQLVNDKDKLSRLRQFINEIVLLSQIKHKNVLKLLGCCLETEIPFLVYEFCPNGTLSDLIHNNTEFPFTWDMRLKIAIDTSAAFAYLHCACSVPIIHRDIKSSNILLDEKYIAKVSDFGLSRSLADDQTHLVTVVAGTRGYLDPEYYFSEKLTEKSDVYSFGVLLLELLTGRKPTPATEEGSMIFTSLFQKMKEADNRDQILDAQVSNLSIKEPVSAVAKLAQSCLNSTGGLRPTMREVAATLEEIRLSHIPSTSTSTSRPRLSSISEIEPEIEEELEDESILALNVERPRQ